MPVKFNVAALAIAPLAAVLAPTLSDQIDALYWAADDPSTPKDRAEALAKLAAKLHAKREVANV